MRACLCLRFALPAISLAAGLSAQAQTLANKRPMVFVWAEDSQTMQRQPLGSGFVLNPQGDVVTARHVVETVVQGQHPVVSIATKSAFPVRVDMNDLECSQTQDFCLIRVLQDLIDGLGLPGFYRLGCHLPRNDEPPVAAGFIGGATPDAGVVTPSGAVIGDMITGRPLPTSIPLESTMSGGPVFDGTMTVIGLVKGGTTGGQFGHVQLRQPARSIPGDRGFYCARAREETSEQSVGREPSMVGPGGGFHFDPENSR